MKNKFFAKHAKSSAALVSLGIHAVLIVVALSFVAVTVITKEDQVFEAKEVKRPKMALKKLQVPVNIKKKKTQKPKLRKRIVVQPKMNQTMPDIKMPEITGVKGGLGNAAGAGLGGAGSLGFNMPEMSLFGVKSRGEKVFIILDTSGYMMVDTMGGIPAYTIIKSELVRILEGLNPAVLFNIAIYEGNTSYTLYPSLVSASVSNVAKVEGWLKPLNAVSTGMGDRDYGTKTKGAGGARVDGTIIEEPLKNNPGEWARPALQAMEQGADVVFLLSCRWGTHRYKVADNDKKRKWSEEDQRRYMENIKKAKALHEKENERRRGKGQPPRVITRGDRGLVMAYLPSAPTPPGGGITWHNYSPDELVEAFQSLQDRSRPILPTRSGIGRKKKKSGFSFNVIHFIPEDAASGNDAKFSEMASLTRGEYSRVKGMAAIQSYVSASEADDLAATE
ncbi:vWA domain-containing protein [Pontiella sulfatireligans]|uniref:VWFA domain-containing protein n=1 Tax=Pontiella sulfatireligans TaxID=2750658 RepID=A0A6C2UG41_9BACT|nr:hypothetical protein [Pontiella sulfatireligans]VGO18391.1 hypothetical protein SCARR_00443 [Pontiella sulfatireligans]